MKTKDDNNLVTNQIAIAMATTENSDYITQSCLTQCLHYNTIDTRTGF